MSVITVDIGTTSMRAVLYDANSHMVHMDQQENVPEYFSDGRVEQDASAWKGILPEALEAAPQQRGIGESIRYASR